MLVDARQARRRRDPGLLLRAEARRAGRRLPHVPGRDRGHPEAADRLLDAGPRRHGRLHADRPGQGGAERGRRVPARQPPARLPGLRQGRRVPAAGHLVWAGARARAASSSPSATSRSRSRSRRWSRSTASAASSATAACASARRSPRTTSCSCSSAARTTFVGTFDEPPLHRAVPRQHHRALPGRRADLATPTASARGPWDIEDVGLGLHALPEPVQRQLHRPRRARRCACSPATTTRSTTAGSATRAASPSRRSTSTSGSPQPLVRDGGELRPVTWERRARRRPRRRCASAGARAAALVGGETTNEEGFLLQRIAARGARLRRPRLARRAARSTARLQRALGAPGAAGDGRRPRLRRTPSSCSAPTRSTRRRSSTCGSARRVRRHGARAGRRHRAPDRARRRRAPATLRYAPGGGEALPRRARRRARRRRRRLGARAPAAGADATRSRALADALRDAGEDVVIVWGERLGRGRARRRGARALLEPRRRARARAAATARACSRSRPAPTAAACARSAACRTPARARRAPRAGRDADADRATALADGELDARCYLLHADPLATYPDARRLGRRRSSSARP